MEPAASEDVDVEMDSPGRCRTPDGLLPESMGGGLVAHAPGMTIEAVSINLKCTR